MTSASPLKSILNTVFFYGLILIHGAVLAIFEKNTRSSGMQSDETYVIVLGFALIISWVGASAWWGWRTRPKDNMETKAWLIPASKYFFGILLFVVLKNMVFAHKPRTEDHEIVTSMLFGLTGFIMLTSYWFTPTD